MRRLAGIIVVALVAAACSGGEPEFTVPAGASVERVNLTLNGAVQSVHPDGTAVLATDPDGKWCRVSLMTDEVACLNVSVGTTEGVAWQPEGNSLLVPEPEALRSSIVDFDTGEVLVRTISAAEPTMWTSWTPSGSDIVGVDLGELDDGGTAVNTSDRNRPTSVEIGRVPGAAVDAWWSGENVVWIVGPDNIWTVSPDDGSLSPIGETVDAALIGTDASGSIGLFLDVRARALLRTNSTALRIGVAGRNSLLDLSPPRQDVGGAIVRDAAISADGSVVAAVWYSLVDQTAFLTAAPVDTEEGTIGEWTELHEWAASAPAPDGLLHDAPMQWAENGIIYAVTDTEELLRIDLDF